MERYAHTDLDLLGIRPTRVTRICPARRDRPLLLSFEQERLWQADRARSSLICNTVVQLRLRGKLNGRALLAALDRIVARHESLRTIFRDVEGVQEQVIQPRDTGFALRDEGPQRDVSITDMTHQEMRNPFNLSEGPLIRGRLLRLTKREHVLLITQHQIVADHGSVSVLIRELTVLYQAFADGRCDPLQPLEIQYADYACWQRARAAKGPQEKSVMVSSTSLGKVQESTLLATDRPRPTVSLHASRTRRR